MVVAEETRSFGAAALLILLLGVRPVSVSAWVIVENGERRPILLEGAGDVRAQDLPESIRSAMQVDPLTRTVEWRGDRGWLRVAEGERLALKNGRKFLLPRPVRFLESTIAFPEDILKNFSDIFSFVETASADDVLLVHSPHLAVAEPSPQLKSDPPQSATGPTGLRKGSIQTVVIDPGHGGGDPGARGKSGAVEKDIVIGIALHVAALLQERDPGIRVVMTRRRDEFVSLQDRARRANSARGDLFVSIHANSVRKNADASGFEVYHLDLEGANDEVRALATFENAESTADAVRPPTPVDIARILGDVMQLQYLDASLDLSKSIADQMSASLEGASKFRGSKGAFFYVLKDVLAPAVLVEVGFVTNDWESSFLQKPWYQRKIADGIVGGILKFKEMEIERLRRVTERDASSQSDSPRAAPGPSDN